MSRKKKEVLTPQVITQEESKKSFLPMIIGMAKMALPDITNGMVQAKDFYYDPETGKTTLSIIVHGDKDYMLDFEHTAEKSYNEYRLVITDPITEEKNIVSYRKEFPIDS